MFSEYDELCEHYDNNYENCGSDRGIKLEDSIVQTGNSSDTKVGLPSINLDNFENIKVENADDLLNGDIDSIKNYEFSLISHIKADNIKVENSDELLSEDAGTLENCQFGLKKKDVLGEYSNNIFEGRSGNAEIKLEDSIVEVGNSLDLKVGISLISHGNLENIKHLDDLLSDVGTTKNYDFGLEETEKPKVETCTKGEDLSTLQDPLLRDDQVPNSEGSPYLCKFCGKCFKRKNGCTTHQNRHSTGFFTCNQCGESFECYLMLQFHNKFASHMVFCTQCGKSFVGKRKLQSHIQRVHTAKKVHVCSYCGQTCAYNAELETHIRTHTGEKPFTCEICMNSFASKSTLATHKKTHRDPYMLTCEFCKMSFSTKRRLTDHITSQHAGVIFG